MAGGNDKQEKGEKIKDMNRKQVIDYLEKNEMGIQSANAALISCDLVFGSYANSQRTHGVNFSPVFCYIAHKYFKAFFQIIPKKNIDRIARKVYRDYIKNPKSLISKLKKQSDLQREIDKIWEEYKKISNINSERKKLIVLYRDFVKYSRDWWAYGAIGEDKGEFIDLEIIPKFAKRHNLNLGKAAEIFNILAHPKGQSVLSIERKEFLNVCLYILRSNKKKCQLKKRNFEELLKDKKLKLKVNRYIKKYFWFKTDFYKAREITPDSLLKEVLKETTENKKENLLKELKKIDSNFNRIERQKEKLLSKMKLTSEDRKDIRFSQLTIQWVDKRKEDMMKQFYYLLSILEDISAKLKKNFHHLSSYTTEELEMFLKKDRTLPAAEIKKRDEGTFLVYEKNWKTKMFFSREGRKMYQIATNVKQLGELKGQVASTGGIRKIKGKVKLIYDPARDRLNKGEILVTSMTRVDFVPLMRKAKAIITNEGGVACHAAIISRELNLPCVIGTKIATKTLKDGDLVEIDLNGGTVKIIKK